MAWQFKTTSLPLQADLITTGVSISNTFCPLRCYTLCHLSRNANVKLGLFFWKLQKKPKHSWQQISIQFKKHTEMALMRRGWVQTTRQMEPNPRLMWSSRMNWVTWVVFPHPVSPLTTTTRLELISAIKSLKWRDRRRSEEDTVKVKRDGKKLLQRLTSFFP